MNNMRLIFTLVTVFAASNALAIGNNYINPGKGICNLDPLPFVDENGNPAFGQFRSESGNKIGYTMARHGEVIKAHCLMKGHDFPIRSAVKFDPETVPGRLCRVQLNDYPVEGTTTDYYTQNYRGTITPSGNIKLHCTCDTANGCRVETTDTD